MPGSAATILSKLAHLSDASDVYHEACSLLVAAYGCPDALVMLRRSTTDNFEVIARKNSPRGAKSVALDRFTPPENLSRGQWVDNGISYATFGRGGMVSGLVAAENATPPDVVAAVALLLGMYEAGLDDANGWKAEKTAMERERMRIARLMHAELGGSLGSVALITDMVRADLGPSHAEGTRLAEAGLTLREVVVRFREVIWILNPLHDSIDATLIHLKDIVLGACREILHSVEIPDKYPLPPVAMEFRRATSDVLRMVMSDLVRRKPSQLHVIITPTEETLDVDIRAVGPVGPRRIFDAASVAQWTDAAAADGGTVVGVETPEGMNIHIAHPYRR